MGGKHTAIPRDNGKVIAVWGPTKTFLGLSEAFQLHRKLAFTNFVVRETLGEQISSTAARAFTVMETDLQLVGQTELFHRPDEPFGRVVLVPLDGVSIVHWELVVEIVVTLSDGNEGGDHVIAGRMLVVERSLAEPVSEGIDTEGRLSTNRLARYTL